MRYIAAVLALVTLALLVPSRVAAQVGTVRREGVVSAAASSTQTSISGGVVTPTGQPVVNAKVQARNLLTGRIDGWGSTTASGRFLVAGLNPGNYVLEVVDATGQIVGTSPFILVTAGQTVATTVTVTSGALSAMTTTGLPATLTSTAAQSVRYAAVAAGVAGLVLPVETKTASPSR
jgi:hypothetical protein